MTIPDISWNLIAFLAGVLVGLLMVPHLPVLT